MFVWIGGGNFLTRSVAKERPSEALAQVLVSFFATLRVRLKWVLAEEGGAEHLHNPPDCCHECEDDDANEDESLSFLDIFF